MDKAGFERDVGVLRNLIKRSGIETDDYKIIIYVERYILQYGKNITKKTVDRLLSCNGIERQEIILDVLQDVKIAEELIINIKK